MADFELREDSYGLGQVMILRSSWKPEHEKVLRERRIEALRLSYSAGFYDKDVRFVSLLNVSSWPRNIQLGRNNDRHLKPEEPGDAGS